MLHLKYQKRGLNILAIPCSDFGSSLTDAQVREVWFQRNESVFSERRKKFAQSLNGKFTTGL